MSEDAWRNPPAPEEACGSGLAREWRRRSLERRRPDDAAHWDARAATFGTNDAPSGYVDAFLRLADLRPGETVFDMGCGTGGLAIPLARAGHAVTAADFSRGMLDELRRRADGLADPTGPIDALLLSWDDPWERWVEAGVGEGSFDAAFASRSIITVDMEDSLARLDRVASRRVCLTVSTGVSPRVDPRVLEAMGLEPRLRNDAAFAFGIASDLGYRPSLDRIVSPRVESFESPQAAFDKLFAMADLAADPPQERRRVACAERLRAWLDEHLAPAAHGGWALDEPRQVEWAFVSWDADRRGR